MNNELNMEFQRIFQQEPQSIYFAPGRVNLIGEHTDYNGGHVFPCALSIGTYAIISLRNDELIHMYSTNFSELGVITTSLKQLEFNSKDDWANYPKGVIHTLLETGRMIDRGFNVLFSGTIPNGSGLSSSASIELVMAVALNELFSLNIDRVELVQLCQKAENQYIGVQCGIMDQFAIGMGKKDCAILLDTNTLHYEYAPLALDGYKIVIANTNKKRGLADSKYNERREECENALRDLQSQLKIQSLGELSKEEFLKHQYLIQNETERKRAKHAVFENIRTLEAVEALRNNDLKTFGQLMNESHVSLRDDYEVTGIELDTLVEYAWQTNAIGSRMTGAGFGGCTVSLVNVSEVESFVKEVGTRYEESIGYAATFYVVEIGDGARLLEQLV